MNDDNPYEYPGVTFRAAWEWVQSVRGPALEGLATTPPEPHSERTRTWIETQVTQAQAALGPSTPGGRQTRDDEEAVYAELEALLFRIDERLGREAKKKAIPAQITRGPAFHA